MLAGPSGSQMPTEKGLFLMGPCEIELLISSIFLIQRLNAFLIGFLQKLGSVTPPPATNRSDSGPRFRVVSLLLTCIQLSKLVAVCNGGLIA